MLRGFLGGTAHAACELFQSAGRAGQRDGNGDDLVFEAVGDRFQRRALVGLGLLAGGDAVEFGFAQRDAVVAEHAERAGERSDLVAAVEPFDFDLEIAGRHLAGLCGEGLQRPGQMPMGEGKRDQQRRRRAADQAADGDTIGPRAKLPGLVEAVLGLAAENVDQAVDLEGGIVPVGIET